ncbi:MAG: hypothetical protein M3546_09560 [Actinomycetota bacterium]|nr:hypothetical protein [Actinomycetota bacterium]
MAFAFVHDSGKAKRVEDLYESARFSKNPKVAVLLARLLKEQWMSAVPDDEVTAPWAMELIHKLVNVIDEGAPPGTTVRLERDGEVFDEDAPSSLRLPCKDCGYAFESGFKRRRYRRTCGRCFEYEPKVPDHPRGGLVVYKRGVYPKHRQGQTLGVVEYGQNVLCNHPDCLELVLVAGHNRDYCDEHHRESVRRLRQVRPPKEERFRFRLAPGVNSVQYAWGPRAEVTEVPPGGRFARDEEELLVLASFLAVGSAHADGRAIPALVAEDTLS